MSPRLLGLLGDDRLAELVRQRQRGCLRGALRPPPPGDPLLLPPHARQPRGRRGLRPAHLRRRARHAGRLRRASSRSAPGCSPSPATAASTSCALVATPRPAELDDVSTDGLSAEVERRDDLRALLGDLGRLRDDQREALVLSELRALPHEEIAAVIGVPPAKVKALVYQARQNLSLDRQARETPCAEVRETLAVPTSGALRAPLRRHLATCDGCRAFRAEVRSQRRALAILLPVVPGAGPQGLRARPVRRRHGRRRRPRRGPRARRQGARGQRGRPRPAGRRRRLWPPWASSSTGARPRPRTGARTRHRDRPRRQPPRSRPSCGSPSLPPAPPAARPRPSARRRPGRSSPPRAKTRPTAAKTAPVHPASTRSNTPTRGAGRTDPGANARGRALGNRGTGKQTAARPGEEDPARHPASGQGRRQPPGRSARPAKKTAAE